MPKQVQVAEIASIFSKKDQNFKTPPPPPPPQRSENVHKLSPAATKNADSYRTITRPVNNMTMRSDYNSKQQSNTPPNLGGSAISEIKEGGSAVAYQFCALLLHFLEQQSPTKCLWEAFGKLKNGINFDDNPKSKFCLISIFFQTWKVLNDNIRGGGGGGVSGHYSVTCTCSSLVLFLFYKFILGSPSDSIIIVLDIITKM